jgi:hypothetical protein
MQPHRFVAVKREMGDVEATGFEVGDGFVDDGVVFDPIMKWGRVRDCWTRRGSERR